MSGANLARETMTKVRKQKAKGSEELPRVGEYSTHDNGGSLVSALSTTAQDMLGISKGDEMVQYLDYENSAIVIIPKSEIPDSEE